MHLSLVTEEMQVAVRQNKEKAEREYSSLFGYLEENEAGRFIVFPFVNLIGGEEESIAHAVQELVVSFTTLKISRRNHPAHKQQLTDNKTRWANWLKENSDADEEKRMSFYYTYRFNRYLILRAKMVHVGPMAGVRFPTKKVEGKVMVVFFAPSNSTNVADKRQPLDWNPFEDVYGNNVKSFQHLKQVCPSVDFDQYYLIDMFPHLIWDPDMELEDEDYDIACLWLNNQVKLIQPTEVFIANKTQGKKIRRRLEFKNTLISHPGYTNRNPDLVAEEWNLVCEAASAVGSDSDSDSY